jgi:glycosyltransferase involved in cell wall biosynthesis
MRPKISVIIPTKNRYDSLKRCLGSLQKQSFRDFEIVVVDGGSDDKTEALVKEFADKLPVVFMQQSGGLVHQMNKGWRGAKGEIIIRTDDDIIATADWLKEIISAFNMSETIGGVTGPTVIPDGHKKYRDLFYFQKKIIAGNFFWRIIGKVYFNYFLEGEPYAVSKWFRSGAFSLGSNYKECLQISNCIEVSNQEACNMAVKKDLLIRINGFDESFSGIGEYNEPDVTFKIRKLGYRIIFNPKAAVYHLPSIEGFFKERPAAYSRMENFIQFYFRHIIPDNLDKGLRFISYLIFLNLFFIYKGISSLQFNQFGCISATLVGLTKNILKTKHRAYL